MMLCQDRLGTHVSLKISSKASSEMLHTPPRHGGSGPVRASGLLLRTAALRTAPLPQDFRQTRRPADAGGAGER